MAETTRIKIPADAAKAIEDHLDELGARSLEEYVSAVLTDHLRRLGYLSAYTQEEEEEVERRLRDLGYID